jgi:hypothetical protein
MTERLKKRKMRSLSNVEEKLASYELLLYKEAFKLDRKRKISYIQ